ncbi:MAG: FAD-dependent oxidoreductase [Roseiflexaceae bacterium]|nr:FAD-dependent oxidoreductase [Roseiflexaceae bacterium]
MHAMIIGAGLAGLTCARELDRHGVDVTLIEASNGVGGRVRTDYVDGYTLDRGFQVLFDAYPAVQRQLDLTALDLQPFEPGAIICFEGQRIVLTDPLRDPDLKARLQATIDMRISPFDKLRTLLLALELKSQTIGQMLTGPDTSSLNYLRQRGFSERFIDLFFRPFYGGILFDRALQTSAKCLKFDFKMLAEGQTAVPLHGMGEISEQLARPLMQRGRIRLNTRAERIFSAGDGTHIYLVGGETLQPDVIVLATSAPEVERLSGEPMPTGAKQTATIYLNGDQRFYSAKKLVLNANPDAYINNAQLLTNVNPAYAPVGKHLLSAVTIGIPTITDTQLYRAVLTDLHAMFAGDIKAQAALATYQPLAIYRIPYAQFDQPPGLHARLPDNRTQLQGVYLAGEYTEASSLNAAMVSGEKCAVAIIKDLRMY